jgi:hypothetical protein
LFQSSSRQFLNTHAQYADLIGSLDSSHRWILVDSRESLTFGSTWSLLAWLTALDRDVMLEQATHSKQISPQRWLG